MTTFSAALRRALCGAAAGEILRALAAKFQLVCSGLIVLKKSDFLNFGGVFRHTNGIDILGGGVGQFVVVWLQRAPRRSAGFSGAEIQFFGDVAENPERSESEFFNMA